MTGGINEDVLLDRIRTLEAATREQEVQLAMCKRERTTQAQYAVKAEDRARYAEGQLAQLKPMLVNLYGMLEFYDQQTAKERWPQLKEYV